VRLRHRYNPELLPQLEQSVEQQVRGLVECSAVRSAGGDDA
jgi:hypothetical protein